MIKLILTPNDIFVFYKHHTNKNKPFIQRYIHWICLSLLILAIAIFFYRNNTDGMTYLMLVPFAFLVALLQVKLTNYLQRKSIMAYIQKNPQTTGKRVLDFDAENLFVEMNGKRSSYPFSSIIRLDECKTHFFAYVGEKTAIIIPKRLLEQNKETEDLILKIKETL